MNVWYKILIFFPVWFLFSGIFVGLIGLIYPEYFIITRAEFLSDYRFLFFTQLATLLGAISSLGFMNKFILKEKNFYSRFILKIRGLSIGILYGFLMISGAVIIIAFFTGIQIHYQGLSFEVLYYLIIFFIVAVSEEVISRGFILHTLYHSINIYLAVLISSFIFALMHIFNESINLTGMIDIFLAGILFSLLYLNDMNLSIPIGLHFSWNFFQGPVFGYQVSGLTTPALFRINNISGHDFLINDFGLEGSVVTLTVELFAITYFFFYYRRNKLLLKYRRDDIII